MKTSSRTSELKQALSPRPVDGGGSREIVCQVRILQGEFVKLEPQADVLAAGLKKRAGHMRIIERGLPTHRIYITVTSDKMTMGSRQSFWTLLSLFDFEFAQSDVELLNGGQ